MRMYMYRVMMDENRELISIMSLDDSLKTAASPHAPPAQRYVIKRRAPPSLNSLEFPFESVEGSIKSGRQMCHVFNTTSHQLWVCKRREFWVSQFETNEGNHPCNICTAYCRKSFVVVWFTRSMSGKLQRPGWPPSRKPIHFPVSYLEGVQIRCVVWDAARDRSEIITVERCNSWRQFPAVSEMLFGITRQLKQNFKVVRSCRKVIRSKIKIDYASIIICVNTLSGLITILIKSSNGLFNISWQNSRQLLNLHLWAVWINIQSKFVFSEICASLVLKCSLIRLCEKRQIQPSICSNIIYSQYTVHLNTIHCSSASRSNETSTMFHIKKRRTVLACRYWIAEGCQVAALLVASRCSCLTAVSRR